MFKAEKNLNIEKLDKSYRYDFAEISKKTQQKKQINFIFRLINITFATLRNIKFL